MSASYLALHASLASWAERQQLPCDVCGDAYAIFSRCRRFRYVLTRPLLLKPPKRRRRRGSSVEPPPPPTLHVPRLLVTIGLNPSTATASDDDPTIRRLRGYGATWGCSQLVMLNAYAYRATDPDDMWDARHATFPDGLDVVGEHNDAAISFVLELLGSLDGIPLAGWGVHAERARAERIADLARSRSVSLQCLGTNQDGSPKHPLYLKKTLRPRPWALPEAA